MKRNIYRLLLAGLMISSTSFANTATVHRGHHSASVTSSRTFVDINHATATQLSAIKGLGMKRATAIIAYRKAHGPFMSIDDLTSVKGVGKKMLMKIKKNTPGRLGIGS